MSNMRMLLIVLVVLFIIAFVSPYTYFSLIHLSRTIFLLLVGFCIGYLLAKVSK